MILDCKKTCLLSAEATMYLNIHVYDACMEYQHAISAQKHMVNITVAVGALIMRKKQLGLPRVMQY